MTDRPAAGSVETNICLDCAMCCDGTLFNKARVSDDDAPELVAATKFKFSDKGKTFFPQPCQYLRGCACSIYEGRFSVCRSFNCALLRDLKNGVVTGSEASATVRKAKQLVAAVVENDPDARFYSGRKQARKELDEGLRTAAPEHRGAIARRLLNIVAMDEFLAAHFRKKRKP